MTNILALWATPRSTSTAFEWVMSHRGDLQCFHEPYNEAFYYGCDRRNHRYFIADPDLKTDAQLSFASIHQKMISLSARQAVFIKDFAYSVSHLADDQFLDLFSHSFLIRDPAKVITSIYARWPDVTLAEIGFEDLHTLFMRVCDRNGRAPMVIDSDQLLQSPQRGMAAYCAAMEIPFMADAMNWEDKKEVPEKNNPTWNKDEHGFHDSLKASTGLKPQRRDYPPIESNSQMIRLYEASLPYYQAMFEHCDNFTGLEDDPGND